MNKVVLVTGATGFLGCNICKVLCENDYIVIATRRTNSSLKNFIGFDKEIIWVNIDNADWKKKIIKYQPSMIVHAAWIGVVAADRNNWELQSNNILFLQEVLQVAQLSHTIKFIGLGSQAEYGFTENIVEESHPLNPKSAYGAIKIISSELLKTFCIQNNIEWYWLRIFSVFGENETTEWLLPSVINTIIEKKVNRMSFSPGDQKYAYLYVKDFAKAVLLVLSSENNNSGIYNLSSSSPLPLKKLITSIRDKINSAFQLGFGELPYRSDQSMLVAGSMSLFDKRFGKLKLSDFDESLTKTINSYLKLTNESI